MIRGVGSHGAVVFLFLLLGFSIYSGSLKGEFLWDDAVLVEKNLQIRSFSSAGEVFLGEMTSVESKRFFYRPLQILSYGLDYVFWGLEPYGYHFTNILLHVLASLSVVLLVSLLCQNGFVSIFTGLLFLISPVQAETVCYISNRSDLLSGLFVFISLICHIKGQNTGKIRYAILLSLAYTVALFSRESGLVVIPLILLYDFAFRKKSRISHMVSILVLTVTYMFFRCVIANDIKLMYAVNTSLTERIPGFFSALSGYVRLMFFPTDMHMEYGNKIFGIKNISVINGFCVFLVVILSIILAKKRNRRIFFALAWFIAALLPVSNIYPLNAYMAEHWLYVPSVGFFMFIALVCGMIYEKERFRAKLLIGITCVLVSFSFLTSRQTEYWKDQDTFFRRTLLYAPDSAKIYFALGYKLLYEGKIGPALLLYEKARDLEPEKSERHFNLGYAYTRAGLYEKAVVSYKKAIELDPDNAKACGNISNIYLNTGNNKAAILWAKKALSIEPDLSKVQYLMDTAGNRMKIDTRK